MATTGTYLICYDVADRRRLRRVAKLMEQHGLRVQRSVFVCRLSPSRRERLEARLRRIIHPERDAVSLYPVCARCEAAAVHLGLAGPAPAQPVVLIA